jgi:hypothetical protein
LHTLEPHFNWRHLYQANQDPRSPFYGYENSEVFFTDKIYDHVIHPQWDNFGAETLFIKQLYADYEEGYTILEFMGEWNDVLHNDIMTLKRDVLEPMMLEGITRFILIGENLINFHADISDYYEEWFDEVEEGWIALVNFRPHVLREISDYGLDQYLIFGGMLDDLPWQRSSPKKVYTQVKKAVEYRL